MTKLLLSIISFLTLTLADDWIDCENCWNSNKNSYNSSNNGSHAREEWDNTGLRKKFDHDGSLLYEYDEHGNLIIKNQPIQKIQSTYTLTKKDSPTSKDTSLTPYKSYFSIEYSHHNLNDSTFEDTSLQQKLEIQPNTHLSTIFSHDSSNPFNYMFIISNEYFNNSPTHLQNLICSGYSKFGRELSHRPLKEFFLPNNSHSPASIYIYTIPPNTKIYIDNSFAGISNIQEIKTSSGTHTFKFLKKDGNFTTKSFTLYPGKNDSKRIELN